MDRWPPGHVHAQRRVWTRRNGLAGAMFAAAVSAQAQPAALPTAPNAFIEELRLRERERALREQQEQLVEPAMHGAPPADERLPTDEAGCSRVDAIVIEGDESKDWLWLRPSLAGKDGDDSPIGRCLGTEGANVLLRRLQRAFIQRSWVAGRAFVKRKLKNDGVLTLAVFAGRLRSIRFADGASPRTALWNAIPLERGEWIRLRATEQGLENLQRVPTAEATIHFDASRIPEEQAGLTDLVITYTQPRRLRASLSVDDSGTRATGRYQGGLTFSADNPLGLNDLFYFSANHGIDEKRFVSAASRGTESQVLHYSVPYGYWLLSATASNSRYHQSVASFDQRIVYSGTSNNAEFKLSRVVYRDQRGRTALGLRALRSESRSSIDDTEIGVQHRVVGGWELGLNHREFIGEATLDGNLAYRRGTGAFGAIRAPEEAFGEGTSRLRLFTADVGLKLPFRLGEQKLRYIGLLRAQWNRTPLLAQDRFGIGGRYTVRGFDGEASLLGDRGWFLRNDLGVALGESGAELYAGVDYGQVGGPSTPDLPGRHLAGGVIGLRGVFEGLNYDIFLGAPISKPQGFRTAGVSAGFNLNFSF